MVQQRCCFPAATTLRHSRPRLLGESGSSSIWTATCWPCPRPTAKSGYTDLTTRSAVALRAVNALVTAERTATPRPDVSEEVSCRVPANGTQPCGPPVTASGSPLSHLDDTGPSVGAAAPRHGRPAWCTRRRSGYSQRQLRQTATPCLLHRAHRRPRTPRGTDEQRSARPMTSDSDDAGSKEGMDPLVVSHASGRGPVRRAWNAMVRGIARFFGGVGPRSGSRDPDPGQ
jgi:hypothetical protein